MNLVVTPRPRIPISSWFLCLTLLCCVTMLFEFLPEAWALTFATVRPVGEHYSPDNAPVSRILPGQRVELPFRDQHYAVFLIGKEVHANGTRYAFRKIELRPAGAGYHIVQISRQPNLEVTPVGLQQMHAIDREFQTKLILFIDRKQQRCFIELQNLQGRSPPKTDA
ncbi:hypothetical protein DSUL_20062 [Desulfovibrionales bacterium]